MRFNLKRKYLRLLQEKKKKIEGHSIWELYRFASKRDKCFLSLAVLSALIGGTVVPLLLMAFGDLHKGMITLGLEHNNPFSCAGDSLPPAALEINVLPPEMLNGIPPGMTAEQIAQMEIKSPGTINFQNTTNKSHQYLLGKTNDTHDTVQQHQHYSAEIMKKVKDELMKHASNICIRMTALALLQWLTLYVTTALAGIAAVRQGFRIRSAFLKSLLHQDIAWFDAQQKENFAVRIIKSLDCVQDGIGEKITLSLLYYSNAVAVLATGFFYAWKVGLVILSSMPLVFAAVYLTSKIQMNFTRKEMQAYSKAGSVVEEALSGIRTVFAYGAEEREASRYKRALQVVFKLGSRQAVILGLGSGFVFFLAFSGFGLGLWYGCRTVVQDRCLEGALKASDMLAVILCVLNAAVSVSQAARNFEAFSTARAAAVKIFRIIDRVPNIDSSSSSGLKPNEPIGAIEFKDVYFHYPLRQDAPILRGFNFSVRPGETVAFVGPSGCGKSTVMHLLQRFYDPVKGEILVDGTNLRDLNVGWVRSQIGVVGQEPVLFESSIADNIGLGGCNVSHGAIVQASITAGAHDFIMKMPQQYNTLVGEKGAQLSGGQKQRIAIARAIVRDPKILLLDEATSALDSVSESTVQAALDLARKGRITLVIAHRLSTTRNADRIVVMRDGVAEETGSHSQLMEKGHLYYNFVISQTGLPKGSSNDLDQIPEIPEEIILSSDNENDHSSRRKSSGHSFKETILRMLPIDEVTQFRHHGNKSDRFRLFSLCCPEWYLLLIGVLASIVVGSALPLFSDVFTKSADALVLQKAKAFKRIDELALCLVGIGISAAVGSFIQNAAFGLAGERQTLRLRKRMFGAMLSQDLAWYDDAKNASGSLCAQITTDAANVKIATVGRLRSVFQAFSTLALCMYMEFEASVPLGLIAAAFIPVVFISTHLNKTLFGGNHLTEKLAEDLASKTAVEAIRSIRTVASLHRQDTFLSKFIEYMQKPFQDMPRICHFNGFTYGLSQSAMPFACVAALYYGTCLIIDGELEFSHIFNCVQAIIISMVTLAETMATSPDYSKSWQAAGRILELLNSERMGKKGTKGKHPVTIRGHISFRNVHFGYPLRPEVKVLRGLDLKVKAGQTVALVGTSGCGKSTCVGLLQRFYDCKKGEILIDGVNIKDYDVSWLRSQMGLVSQEPSLFGISVAENIAYGEGNNKLSAQELVEAARTANIHNFICALPEGYQTKVGGSESWLSAGEKQRVAIARALVRNPTVLLLDEATSALDTESEQVVQEALDKAREGRTCIVIAHRLSTIQNADLIAVIHEGVVVEKGKHFELLSKRGFYYKMYTMQQANQ